MTIATITNVNLDENEITFRDRVKMRLNVNGNGLFEQIAGKTITEQEFFKRNFICWEVIEFFGKMAEKDLAGE